MKKILCIIIAAIALAVAPKTSAQFRYGPTVGLDVTSLKFKQDLFQVDQSLGYQGGLQCEVMIPGIGFGIDFGLLYTQRGATLHLGDKPVWAEYGTRRSYLHYLEIPVDLRFKWTRMQGLEDYIAPFVFGGPTFSFLVAHNDIQALNYAGGDVGLQVGLGLEIMKKLQVQACHQWGMTYAMKTKLLDNLSAQNRTWSVRLVYLF